MRDDRADNDVGRKAAQDIVLNEKVAAKIGFAARLSEMELRSRWQVAVADDEAVQRITSFQQSYNEMIKGEQFVMRESRSQARERLRWYAAMVAAARLAWAIAGTLRSQLRLSWQRTPAV